MTNSSQKTGLGITLKVMAGDVVTVLGKSYYRNSGGSYNTNNNTLLDVLNGFISALNNQGLNDKGATVGPLNNTPNGGISSFFNSQPVGNAESPKAGICWVLLDERMYYVNAGFSRVGTASSGTGILKDHFMPNENSLFQNKETGIMQTCVNEIFRLIKNFHASSALTICRRLISQNRVIFMLQVQTRSRLHVL
jgi:hypothetical protein